jgi:hypothetical protein
MCHALTPFIPRERGRLPELAISPLLSSYQRRFISGTVAQKPFATCSHWRRSCGVY